MEEKEKQLNFRAFFCHFYIAVCGNGRGNDFGCAQARNSPRSQKHHVQRTLMRISITDRCSRHSQFTSLSQSNHVASHSIITRKNQTRESNGAPLIQRNSKLDVYVVCKASKQGNVSRDPKRAEGLKLKIALFPRRPPLSALSPLFPGSSL